MPLAVGGISKRCARIDRQVEEREHFCLTASFNHDLIDGAAAARFISRLMETLSHGECLQEAISEEGRAEPPA